MPGMLLSSQIHPLRHSQWARMGAKQSGKNMGIGGAMRDGAGKRVMQCEMCTEYDKEGRGSLSQVCRGAEHG
jgi:hypothetical protein